MNNLNELEYVELKLEDSNITVSSTSSSGSSSLTNDTISSVNTTTDYSLSSHGSNEDSNLPKAPLGNFFCSLPISTSTTASSSLSGQNEDIYAQLARMRDKFERFKTQLYISEMRNEVENLMHKMRSELSSDLQHKFAQLLYEQTVLSAKLATIQCLVNNFQNLNHNSNVTLENNYTSSGSTMSSVFESSQFFGNHVKERNSFQRPKNLIFLKIYFLTIFLINLFFVPICRRLSMAMRSI